MYRIVIFGGGSGTEELQKGFYQVCNKDTIRIDVIINAYDNGLSTGLCRKCFDNLILGPSDLRKNHLISLENEYSKELNVSGSRERDLYELFSARISASSKEEFISIAKEQIDRCIGLSVKDAFFLYELLDYFFYAVEERKGKNFLNSFDDFSLGNVFYTACAVQNDYSLDKAGRILSAFLGIEDRVHLISNVSLLLHAETDSGMIIDDEGTIVEWNNSTDKIKRVFLTRDGQEYIPKVGENCEDYGNSIRSVIENADIIILGSGTQWSSLIPTYMHIGLQSIITNSNAKKYMIMNLVQDGDMYGVGGNDILSIVSYYLDLNDFAIMLSSNSSSCFKELHTSNRVIEGNFSVLGEKKHKGRDLVVGILKDYFRDILGFNHYVFDFDGTLWDKHACTKEKDIAIENIDNYEGIVLSGNRDNYLMEIFQKNGRTKKRKQIYSDYGNVYFDTLRYESKLIDRNSCISSSIYKKLQGDKEYIGKMKLRGYGSIITLKPFINRAIEVKRIDEFLREFKGLYEVYLAGDTSIDIIKKGYGKGETLQTIILKEGWEKKEVLFIGNEVTEGNDKSIRDKGFETFQVRDIQETNVVIRMINLVNQRNISKAKQ